MRAPSVSEKFWRLDHLTPKPASQLGNSPSSRTPCDPSAFPPIAASHTATGFPCAFANAMCRCICHRLRTARRAPRHVHPRSRGRRLRRCLHPSNRLGLRNRHTRAFPSHLLRRVEQRRKHGAHRLMVRSHAPIPACAMERALDLSHGQIGMGSVRPFGRSAVGVLELQNRAIAGGHASANTATCGHYR